MSTGSTGAPDPSDLGNARRTRRTGARACRRRSRGLGGVLAFTMSVGMGGCGGDDPSADPQAEDPSAATGPASDPLLAEARAALGPEGLPPDIQRRILASEDPAHARARWILADVRGEPLPEREALGPGDGDGDGDTEGLDDGTDAPRLPAGDTDPDTAPDAEGDAPADPEPAAPSVEPPALVVPPEGATQSTAEDPRKRPGTPTGAGPAKAGPALSLITSVDLRKRGSEVRLELRAAAPLEVGVASEAAGQRLRYVVSAAGALPAALQARPEVGGVKVTDLRRGEDTVQIAVELAPGWRARAPERTRSGATIRFRAGA